MKRDVYFVCFMLLLCWKTVFAQINLVPNGSFEITNCCPTNGTELWFGSTCILNWFDPNGGTPDYYNFCCVNPFFNVPYNSCGYQQARHGTAYSGCLFYIGWNAREYIEAGLSQSLLAGKKYYVSFYVNFSKRFLYATDAISAYLTTDSLLNDTNSQYFNMQPQVSNPAGNVITDTLNWVLVADTIIAQGGEKFITIGNFKSDANTNFDTLNWGNDPRCYYLIDDVSVTLIEDSIPIPDLQIPSLLGSGETFTVNGLPENSRLEIYDMRGRLVYENASYDNRFGAWDAEAGLYVYSFTFSAGETRRGKLLIAR